MHGYTKPYFTDETGRLFRDETGNTDNGDSIPMEIEIGRENLGTDLLKTFNSVLMNSENARGAIWQYSIDGGRTFNTLGQITKDIEVMVFPQGGQLIQARDIDFKVVHNDEGAPPIINGPTIFHEIMELKPNEASK